MPELKCPVCGGMLSRRERTLRCEKGHCYDIAKQNYVPGPSPTKAHFEKYKNQPFEKPSYALMDYFANHDFVGKLAVAIRIKQNTLSWGME